MRKFFSRSIVMDMKRHRKRLTIYLRWKSSIELVTEPESEIEEGLIVMNMKKKQTNYDKKWVKMSYIVSFLFNFQSEITMITIAGLLVVCRALSLCTLFKFDCFLLKTCSIWDFHFWKNHNEIVYNSLKNIHTSCFERKS